MILRPTYVDNIMVYADTPLVKILAGVRRCGKFTILKMIVNELVKRGVPENSILHYQF